MASAAAGATSSSSATGTSRHHGSLAPMDETSIEDLSRRFASTLHRLGTELRCTICLSFYSDPVFIPCGHTFCRGCINGWIAAQRQAACPVCKTAVTRRMLRDNDIMGQLIQQFRKLAPEKTRVGMDLPTQFTQLPDISQLYDGMAEAEGCDEEELAETSGGAGASDGAGAGLHSFPGPDRDMTAIPRLASAAKSPVSTRGSAAGSAAGAAASSADAGAGAGSGAASREKRRAGRPHGRVSFAPDPTDATAGPGRVSFAPNPTDAAGEDVGKSGAGAGAAASSSEGNGSSVGAASSGTTISASVHAPLPATAARHSPLDRKSVV